MAINTELRRSNGSLFSDTVYIKSHWSNIDGKPSNFPPTAHAHTITDITDLQTALNNKANTNHTHSQYLTSADIPSTYPATSIIEDTNHRFITDTERYNWNNKETEEGALSKANAAYYNAKSYTDTKISQLINGAPEALDTLKELADALGDNEDEINSLFNEIANKVSRTEIANLKWDSTTKKLYFDTGQSFPNVATEEWVSANFNKYTHPSYTSRASGLYKITVDGTGHVSAVSSVSKSDITALGIPAQDTVYTHPSTHPISMISGLQSALDSKLGTGGTAYNSTRWNGYQLRFGSGLSGASGYITFTY